MTFNKQTIYTNEQTDKGQLNIPKLGLAENLAGNLGGNRDNLVVKVVVYPTFREKE